MNYTQLETEMLVEKYLEKPCTETVENLAEMLGRSKKSIIGKLSREGVYRRESYRTKAGEIPTTKVEIVSGIADNLGMSFEDLEGLEKSPKDVLKLLDFHISRIVHD